MNRQAFPEQHNKWLRDVLTSIGYNNHPIEGLPDAPQAVLKWLHNTPPRGFIPAGGKLLHAVEVIDMEGEQVLTSVCRQLKPRHPDTPATTAIFDPTLSKACHACAHILNPNSPRPPRDPRQEPFDPSLYTVIVDDDEVIMLMTTRGEDVTRWPPVAVVLSDVLAAARAHHHGAGSDE